MSSKPMLPICDECSDPIAECFHAILGGKIFRLCSETCRTAARARHIQPRREASIAAETRPAAQVLYLPRMSCGPYGDEWGDMEEDIQEG